MINIKFLLLTSFVTGTVLMALEMVGSRILAPYFGNSIYVWGNLIGIILLSISVGYFIGGKIADKQSSHQLLYLIIFTASIFILLVLFFYAPLLQAISGLSVIYGSIVATFVLFAVPMLLLSMVPPYIIKLISKDNKVGSTVGTVNSISTVGNIFGIYFATFILIPSIGTRLTLQFCFLTLFAISVYSLARINKRFISLSLVVFVLFVAPSYSMQEDVILEEESLYNHIILSNKDNELRLYLNKEYHSVLNSETYFTGYYYEFFLTLPLLTKGKDMLILGMGAGTSIDQYQHYYEDINIDAVDIDQKVIDIAKKYFHITESDKLRIYARDARPFLLNSDKKYDIIEVDLFHGSPYIPFYVATKEFFTLISDSMNDNGVGAMNVLAPGNNKDILRYIEQTILAVFPSVFEINVNDGNYILIFTKEPFELSDLNDKLKSDNEDIQALIDQTKIVKIEKNDKIQVLTDDKCPVDKLTKLSRQD